MLNLKKEEHSYLSIATNRNLLDRVCLLVERIGSKERNILCPSQCRPGYRIYFTSTFYSLVHNHELISINRKCITCKSIYRQIDLSENNRDLILIFPATIKL